MKLPSSIALVPLLTLGCADLATPVIAGGSALDLQAIESYSVAAEKPQISLSEQFSDLRPQDWAYQALSNLVARYGCVAGYPDGTFQGGRAISRYEAAALLNACLDRVTEVTDELRRLLTELDKELALLRGRVDGLEARVGELEAMKFATTTRLMGVTAMYLNTASGPNKAVSSAVQVIEPGTVGSLKAEPQPLAASVAFQYSTILGFSTSFTGKDMLAVDLYTSNFNPYSSSIFGFTPNLTGTYSTRLSFDAPRIRVSSMWQISSIASTLARISSLRQPLPAAKFPMNLSAPAFRFRPPIPTSSRSVASGASIPFITRPSAGLDSPPIGRLAMVSVWELAISANSAV